MKKITMKKIKRGKLPKQLELGMFLVTYTGETVEIIHDDMHGYPYECFARMATPEEIKRCKRKKVSDRRKVLYVIDDSILEPLCQAVLDAYPEKVRKYKSGKLGIGGFYEAVMKRIIGNSSKKNIEKILSNKLDK